MDRTAYHKAYKAQYRAEKRSVTLTVSAADYDRLLKAAHSEGKRPTTLLHDLAFTAFDRSLYVPADLEAQLRELNRLMLNIANNVNQIAHWSNSHAEAADYGRLRDHIRALHEAIQAYTQDRLGRR